ncbi:MAG: NADH-quinone oxidoreductase subunit C [Rhodocyclaceae bacterium]|jgi:Ni,Fe-hydrogenase III large subunit/Ni,Fe-hydrogenase III component G|nr:NADH-quinone oxidoreductase subunit C [Rhodocyclaceae bacterium]
MPLSDLGIALTPLTAPLPIFRGNVGPADWIAVAATVAAGGGRLVSLWGSDRRQESAAAFVVAASYALQEGLVWIELPLTGADSTYPDLSDLFPAAARMQRATADLLGIRAADAEDRRPWLNHGAWPRVHFPLRREATGNETFPDQSVTDYPFVRVEGDGVHEIAVGPVHAGIIEPGHFRFSVVGEKVLRLEERLGYTHKGTAKRFERLPASTAHRLAGRVSGDSTVAFAWAYCMALEAARGMALPLRAAWLRALLLERERVANHLGDLGALGNDAAFAFGLSQFMLLKEDWLRLNRSLFGHRYLMDCIVPGGVATDIDAAGCDQLVAQCEAVERDVRLLRNIYEDHAGLQDRFIGTGRVSPQLANQLGVTGMAGRASGMTADLRADFAVAPYSELEFKVSSHRNGDVAARVIVRFEEALESLRLIRAIARGLPEGPLVSDQFAHRAGVGAGWIEGWRGEVFVALEVEDERILRCHCHDPSWHNWPALEHAVIGNIVPDFPLINKSFNLSYSGSDL